MVASLSAKPPTLSEPGLDTQATSRLERRPFSGVGGVEMFGVDKSQATPT